jgi:hypothetical protein
VTTKARQSESKPHGHSIEKAVAALVALLLLLSLISLSRDPATVNHDVSWILFAGRRLLEGGVYGIDVVELNPPLILWIGTAVAAFSLLSGLPPEICFNLLVLAGVLGGSFAIYRILLPFFEQAALPFVLALVLAPLQILICDYDYGQRDQLIFLLMTPQILIAALSTGGAASTRRGRLAAAFCTAFAIALKPHFLLVWGATELYSASRARRPHVLWREDNWLIVAVGVVYVVGVALLAPQYFGMAKDAMAVYAAYDAPVPLISGDSAPLFAAALILALLRPHGAVGRAALTSLLASGVSFGCVFLQHKNYPYHYIPVQLFATLAMGLAVAARLDGLPALRERGRVALWIGMGTALGLAGLFWIQGFNRVEVGRRQIAALIEEQGRGRSVLFLSSSVSAAFPVVPMSGVDSASPYPCIWQIAGHYTEEELARTQFPYRGRDSMPPLERHVMTTVVDWMEREEPSLLFFDLKRYQQGFLWANFAWEQYLKADPRFERILAHYRSIGPVHEFYALSRMTPEERP